MQQLCAYAAATVPVVCVSISVAILRGVSAEAWQAPASLHGPWVQASLAHKWNKLHSHFNILSM